MRLTKLALLAPPFELAAVVAGVLGPYCFGPTVASTASHAVLSQGATHLVAACSGSHALLAQGATHLVTVAGAQHAVKAGCDCE